MSSENVNRYKTMGISVGDLKFEIITLGDCSSIVIHDLDSCSLPNTFWLDIQFEVESNLGVCVTSMQLLPCDQRKTSLHIIHKSYDHADPFDKETSVAMNGHCGLANTKPIS